MLLYDKRLVYILICVAMLNFDNIDNNQQLQLTMDSINVSLSTYTQSEYIANQLNVLKEKYLEEERLEKAKYQAAQQRIQQSIQQAFLRKQKVSKMLEKVTKVFQSIKLDSKQRLEELRLAHQQKTKKRNQEYNTFKMVHLQQTFGRISQRKKEQAQILRKRLQQQKKEKKSKLSFLMKDNQNFQQMKKAFERYRFQDQQFRKNINKMHKDLQKLLQKRPKMPNIDYF